MPSPARPASASRDAHAVGGAAVPSHPRRDRIAHALTAAATCLVLVACAASTATATVEDEPICADFEIGVGHTEMKGGLRKPVVVTVLDGSSEISQVMLLGRRTDASPVSRALVLDSNDEVTIRWAQCENDRAPQPTRPRAKQRDATSSYACGEPKVYHEEKLAVRAGDASSRVIHYVPPPEPACWQSEIPPEPAPSGSASAGPSTAPPTASASGSAAASGSASAEPPPAASTSAAASASAVTSASASATATASAAPAASPPPPPAPRAP